MARAVLEIVRSNGREVVKSGLDTEDVKMLVREVLDQSRVVLDQNSRLVELLMQTPSADSTETSRDVSITAGKQRESHSQSATTPDRTG